MTPQTTGYLREYEFESHLIPAGPMRFVDRMCGGVVTFITKAGAPTAL